MNTQDIIDYYADLLVGQYSGKPNAYAEMQILITDVIMDQMPNAVLNAFSLGSAVGVQLDILGKYIGATRYGYNFSGPMTLNDLQFTTFLQICIIQNSAGSDLNTLQNLLNTFFPGTIILFDHANMRIDYFFESSLGSQQLAEFFIMSNRLPKPMGVAIGVVIYAPVIKNFFSFCTGDYPAPANTGFNNGSAYLTNRPWLSYSDIII